MRIEIICTGDEILTGKTINTNFSHISRKLEEFGLSVRWGTTIGDDRAALREAFALAAGRADVVIVNGGLGPTVDDLSQEIAAEAAGKPLVLNAYWLSRIEDRYRRHGMTMSPNNRKQALLPETAELIDNPIGTACGFALDIGQARFYFTPGVPRELHQMVDEQIIPRLLARRGIKVTVRLKRFHTFGLGESHVDALLAGIETLFPDRDTKLGFQTHYPEIETKLTLRGPEPAELQRRLEPIAAEVRRRLGNFIVAEDDDTLESVVLNALGRDGASLAVVETFTCGLLSARLAQPPEASGIFRRGLVAPSPLELEELLDLPEGCVAGGRLTEEAMTAVARAALSRIGATHALAVLADHDETDDPAAARPLFWFTIATGERIVTRRCRFRFGSNDWLRAGSVEMALDTLRRFLAALPITERIDFEIA